MTAWTGFDDLSDIDTANVVRCGRTLLRHPLLHEGGPEAGLLPLVHRHRAVLRELFASLLGYRLDVTRRYARLYKAGPGDEITASTRGADGLSPRGCAYLALVAAALTGAGRQVLLSRLVADVRADAARLGMGAPDDTADRRALTAALRRLVELGVLAETEGSVTGFVVSESDGEADRVGGEEALLTIDTELLGALPAGPVAEADTPEELCESAARPRTRTEEHAVRRRLVEHPAVLYADLPAAQAEWLRANARRESWLLETCFGLRVELRSEGAVAVDPQDYLSDMAFPGLSTPARMASLALPDLMSAGVPGPDGTVTVDGELVHRSCSELVRDYPAAWSKQATADIAGAVAAVTEVLVRAGVAEPGGSGGLRLRPHAHRWAPVPDGDAEPRQPEVPAPDEPGLFEIETGGSPGSEDGTR